MMDIQFDIQAVHDALLEQANALKDVLEAQIQQKLSGDVLQLRSGTLLGSIVSSIENDGDEFSVSISSIGVPYAAIHEFGGKTSAHEIIARNTKALAFVARGHQVFAQQVHHPGSPIPARSYLVSSLTETQHDIMSGFKRSIVDALSHA